MGQITNYLEAAVLDHIFEGTTYTKPTLYAGLLTDIASAEIGTVTEVTVANEYIRKAISFNAAGTRAIVQGAEVAFNIATGSWTVGANHWGIFDAESGGNLLAYGDLLGGPYDIIIGNQPKIPTGSITISLNASAGSGGIPTVTADKILNFVFGAGAYELMDIRVALTEVPMSDTVTNMASTTEVSGAGYTHEDVTGWTLTGSTISNTADIVFGPPTGPWVLQAVAIYDNADGNIVAYGNDVADQPADTGDTVQFLADQLSITLN